MKLGICVLQSQLQNSTIDWLRPKLMYFLYNHKKKKEKLYVEYERKHDSTNLIVQSNPGLIQKKRELANLGFEMLS